MALCIYGLVVGGKVPGMFNGRSVKDWRWRLLQEDRMHLVVLTPTEKLLAAIQQKPTHMVVCNAYSGCVFVKDYDFFVNQGGLHQAWGKRWKPVVAESIEHAREIGCGMFPEAKPYGRQAKP